MAVTYTYEGKELTKKEYVAKLREKYMQNPPAGYTRREIERMRDNDILDMDYFLNEDDEFGEDFPGAEGFYIF